MQGLPCQASRLDGFAIKIPSGHLRSKAERGPGAPDSAAMVSVFSLGF